MYDYAYAELMFCTRWNLEPDGTDQSDYDLRTAFAQGYLEVEPWKMQGLAELAPFRMIACIIMASWLIDQSAEVAAVRVSAARLECLEGRPWL